MWMRAAPFKPHLSGRKLVLFATGTPERTDAKIEKDHDDDGGGDEGAVVGAVGVAEASAPECRCEDEDGKEKEDACDFEPKNAPDAAERLEESS